MKEKTVKCADCTESVPEVDAWWCRDCVKSLCKACNLVKGHTEHRSRKWEKIEILNTCAQALESRCSLRSKEAADEEIAIKEFVAEVEAILVRKVHRRLEAVNERDRLIISRLNRALGEMDQQHKKEGCSSPIYHVPSPNGPAWKQYDSSDNNRVEMLVTEAAAIVNLTGYDIKPYVSITTTNESTPSLTRQQHSFAVLPDAFTAERFARIILESSNVRHRIGSLSNGSPAPNGDGLHMAPIAEDETREMRETQHQGPSTSTPIAQDSADEGKTILRYPLEPFVHVERSNDGRSSEDVSIDGLDHNDSANLSSAPVDYISLNATGASIASSVPSPDSVAEGDLPNTSRRSSATPTQRRPGTGAGLDDSALDNISTSTEKTDSTRLNILSFHFGTEYLTRPIDVCALPGNRLAVSDSCGGVYITSNTGEVLQQLSTDNGSASSLFLNSADRSLLVSVMHKQARSVYAFDIDNQFVRKETLACPNEPRIEASRTRWLAVGARGEIFLASGDNQRSAIWKYSRAQQAWLIVKESRGTRYQYLEVAEDQPEHESVVLMSCEAAQNRLLLFVVSKTGALINEYDLTKTYHLRDYVRSPASAVVDLHGNVLILDYSNGKLWILAGSGGGGVRRIKVLAEIGGQQGLGLAVQGDWAYIACFSKKRIQAIRYLENDLTPIVQESRV